MSQELLQHVAQSSMKTSVPVLQPGSLVRVHQKVKEGNKERNQIFEGLVIKIGAGYGPSKTFTVRKVVEGIGVERVYPFYSPNITKVEIVKQGKVRRAKLYYMRDRSGKSARLRDQALNDLGLMSSFELKEAEALEETLAEDHQVNEAEETSSEPGTLAAEAPLEQADSNSGDDHTKEGSPEPKEAA